MSTVIDLPELSKHKSSARDPAEIRLTSGSISKTASAGEKALQDAGVEIYQRGGMLVRLIVEEMEAAHGRKTKVAKLVRIETTYMRDVLNRVVVFRKYSKRDNEWLQIDPPLEVANTILARVGEWKFPVIAGIISTQTMRPDGSLLTRPGYDPATQLLLVTPPPIPIIPDMPTRDEALAALALLENLLVEFPLVDDVARAVALSALITPVVRGAFPVAPMHAARAPVAGSGKSFLFDTVAAITIGEIMPVMAAGRNEEETEKRLGAAMLAGQPLIAIDNVNGKLSGDALCQIIAHPIVDIRVLGKSEQVRVKARATSIFCTGNNLVLVGDLCRRCIIVTLDPELERPELREFQGNPVQAVLANRGAYIAAALTICRAYVAAGQPNKAGRLASFEGWSDTVRSALIWLGCADPAKSMEIARDSDPELDALRELLNAWTETIGVGQRYRVKLQDVVKLTNERTTDDERKPKWPELHDAVQAVAAFGKLQADARRLGNWAQRNKGRFVDGLRLVNKLNRGHGSKWWVEDRNGERTAPGRWQGADTGEPEIDFEAESDDPEF